MPPPTGIHGIVPSHSHQHPPPMAYPTLQANHSGAGAPISNTWTQPPPSTVVTPQVSLSQQPWPTVQPPNQQPVYGSPPPIASSVAQQQSTQYLGTTAVYPPPSTPQPASFWPMPPVPTPPPPPHSTSQASTPVVDPYQTFNQHPLPAVSPHQIQSQQHPKAAFSQYGNIVVSAAAPVPAASIPHPTAYPLYQQNTAHPVVAVAPHPTPGKAFASTPGMEYYYPSGTTLSSSTVPSGTTALTVPISSMSYSQQAVGGVPGGSIMAAPSMADIGAVNATLGPQRASMYTQPSQVQGYHPYRRV